MNNFAVARQNMFDNQFRANKVTDPAFIGLFLSIPREDFVSNGKETVAYVDEDLSLGGVRPLIEPMVVRRLLQEADIDGGRLVGVIKERNEKLGNAKIYNKLKDSRSSRLLFDAGTPAILVSQKHKDSSSK